MEYEKRTQARMERAIRQVLGQQQAEHRPRQGPIGTIRRKYLISRCRYLAAQYGLAEAVAGFVYGKGYEAITGLGLCELEELEGRLSAMATRVVEACDLPDTPPAR